MSCYFIAQIRIKDLKEYQKYLDRAGIVFKKFNGMYLVLDDKPEILEGVWDYTRTVVIKFNNKKDFKAWYNSAEYQEILKHRLCASECSTILAKGLKDDD
jgi:uncharacterized protein (DUF1330 family)